MHPLCYYLAMLALIIKSFIKGSRRFEERFQEIAVSILTISSTLLVVLARTPGA
jgi:hypothetical protein